MKFLDLPPELLQGVVLMSAEVAVCLSLRDADKIKGAMETMKGDRVDPKIYTFAAGHYLVVMMGNVIKRDTDVTNTNT